MSPPGRAPLTLGVRRLHHQREPRLPSTESRAGSSRARQSGSGPVGGKGGRHLQLVGGGPGGERRQVAGQPERRCHLAIVTTARSVPVVTTPDPVTMGQLDVGRDVEGVGQLGVLDQPSPGRRGSSRPPRWRCPAPRRGRSAWPGAGRPEHQQPGRGHPSVLPRGTSTRVSARSPRRRVSTPSAVRQWRCSPG